MAALRFGCGGARALPRSSCRLGLLLAGMVLLAACGGGGSGGGLPPGVAAITPSDGADGVLVGSTVTVTYTQPMNTVATEAAFSVSPNVNGDHDWSDDATEQTFTPDGPLTPGTTYTVTVSTSAADAAGNVLPEPYTFTFHTGGSGHRVWGGLYWGFDKWKAGN